MMHVRPKPDLVPTVILDDAFVPITGLMLADLRTEDQLLADLNALLDAMPAPEPVLEHGVDHEVANGWLAAGLLALLAILVVLP